MSQLVLSLFPGIGLLDMAFEEEGFCVVRGPDLLWGGDIHRFHPPAGRFDGVIGGPPCQLFSVLKRLNPRAGEKHGNLIPEFERCVREAVPRWFVMENVLAAPLPKVDGYRVKDQLIRDVWVGGRTSRLRRFTFGFPESDLEDGWPAIEQLALHQLPEPTVLAQGGGRIQPVAIGGSGRRKHPRAGPSAGRQAPWAEICRAQGLAEDFLVEAPFTSSAKIKAVGNGVPLPMGRAVARAVKRALEGTCGTI